MDRLETLSDELFSEFDRDSPNYWASNEPVKEVVERVNKEFIERMDDILSEREFDGGVPVPSVYVNLDAVVKKIKTDPFLPRKIRELVVNHLEKRCDVILTVYMTEVEKYQASLARGERVSMPELQNNWQWMHNRVNDRLYENGCGISQIESEVDKIRLAIQDYLESFNPLSKF